MKIDIYKIEHKDGVLNIFKSRPDIFPDNEIKSLVESLSLPPTDEHIKFVAQENGVVTGYIGAIKLDDGKDVWHLDYFSVHPEYLRRGIGTELLRKVESYFTEKGNTKLYIETCSCDGETSARRFYESSGYINHAILKDYYGNGHSKIFYLKTF